MSDDQLLRDLVALGRAADVPAPSDDLASAVLVRVAEPRRTPGFWTRQRRVVALVVAAVALALLATPPVRAAVADWFGFGGVRVERDSTPPESAAPAPGVVPPEVSIAQAATLVDFEILVPAELGAPDGVAVTDDRRMVSMSWTTEEAGVVRLDQFDGRIDYTVVKQVPDISYAMVNGAGALWFDDAHDVTLLREDGTPVPGSARIAGHTLAWPVGGTTLRLEGELDLGTATTIAESAEPVG